MASIMEELIATLSQECELYESLIPIAQKKTKVIIENDLPSLQSITEQEQQAVDKVNALEKKREKVIVNVGTVINKDPAALTIHAVIELLEKQPKEQQELAMVHDKLKKAVRNLMEINNHNSMLIQQSLEMIEFNMNFIQSTRMSPGSNNYTRGAASSEAPVSQTGMFDAKQ